MRGIRGLTNRQTDRFLSVGLWPLIEYVYVCEIILKCMMNIQHQSIPPLHPVYSLGSVRLPIFQTSLTFWPIFLPYHNFWFAVVCCVFNFKLYEEIEDTLKFSLNSDQVWRQCCQIITNIVVGGGTAAIVTICTNNVLYTTTSTTTTTIIITHYYYYYYYYCYYYYYYCIIFFN